MKKLKIAVVGATENIGHEILQSAAESTLQIGEMVALAPPRLAGGEVSFGADHVLTVQDIERFDFKGVDLCFNAADEQTAKNFISRAAKAGCVVIDSSSCCRMDPDVPLVVAGVNDDAIAGYTKRNIIASPCAPVTQLMMALKPLHDAATVKRVVVSTYQPVSAAGKAAMDELFTQSRAIFVNDELHKENFRKQIAFNVIPHIGTFMEDGTTREEWQLAAETKKVLNPKIKVAATCVYVPVFIGMAIAANVEFENPISASEARDALKRTKGIAVVDRQHEDGFVTPAECVGENNVYVSRVREDISVENGLNLWIVTDNLRKGTALNAVQIAEILARTYLR